MVQIKRNNVELIPLDIWTMLRWLCAQSELGARATLPRENREADDGGAPLSYLLGTWRGQGQGCYPTLSTFYTEELHFSHSNPLKPVIAYSQKTWRSPSGPVPQPMHAESGFWRLEPDGSVEVVIAQSTGLVEVQKGSHDVEEKIIRLQSELVGNASKVKEISREFRLVNGELRYVVHMATTLTSLQTHLEAVLEKV